MLQTFILYGAATSVEAWGFRCGEKRAGFRDEGLEFRVKIGFRAFFGSVRGSLGLRTYSLMKGY